MTMNNNLVSRKNSQRFRSDGLVFENNYLVSINMLRTKYNKK